MTEHQEDKQSSEKMGKGPEQTLFQGGQTEGPETYERMLSTTSHHYMQINELLMTTGGQVFYII